MNTVRVVKLGGHKIKGAVCLISEVSGQSYGIY